MSVILSSSPSMCQKLSKLRFAIVRVEVRGSSCVRVKLGSSSEIPRVSHTSTSSRFGPSQLDDLDQLHLNKSDQCPLIRLVPRTHRPIPAQKCLRNPTQTHRRITLNLILIEFNLYLVTN